MTAEPTPSGIRRLGDGYEPLVNEIAGKLVYSIPVESGFMSYSFSFPITEADFSVLQADRYRRAALHWVLHTVLQRSTLPGKPQVSDARFRQLTDAILLGASEEVKALIARINDEHNIALEHYIDAEVRGETL